ncbi:hypothetical protein [Streptomyces sp. NPDC002851]
MAGQPTHPIDQTAWRTRLTRLTSPEISAAVVVQCGLDWLHPDLHTFRNEVDHTLTNAQLHRGTALTITRIVLYNLPAPTGPTPRPRTVDAAFDEWQHRLAATTALLFPPTRPAPRVRRLIIRGDQTEPPIPDMVELRENNTGPTPNRQTQACRSSTPQAPRHP